MFKVDYVHVLLIFLELVISVFVLSHYDINIKTEFYEIDTAASLTLVLGLMTNLTSMNREWNIFLRALTSLTHPFLLSVLIKITAFPLSMCHGCIWYDYNKYNTKYYSPDIIHPSWSVLIVNKHHGPPSVNVRLYLV